MHAFPTVAPIKNPVRIPLPADMGDTLSAGGQLYTADADGVVTLPRDVADALGAHLLQPDAAPVMEDVAALAALIKAIDQQIAASLGEYRQLETAEARACDRLGVAADPGPDVGELTARHKRTLGDFILGLTKRADVDAVEAQRQKAAARATEQARARELAALGVADLRARREPIQKQIAELEERRGVLRKKAIRASAEQAGIELRAAAVEFAARFAAVQAFALILRDDSLRPYSGGIELPAFPQLKAFEDCHGPLLILTPEPAAVRAGRAHEFVDLAAARAEVQQRLAAQGIN